MLCYDEATKKEGTPYNPRCLLVIVLGGGIAGHLQIKDAKTLSTIKGTIDLSYTDVSSDI